MKNGIYNLNLANIQLTGMETTEEALVTVARMIIEMHEQEADLSVIESSFEVVEEFDPEYETDEDDGVDELDFDAA